MRLHKSTLVQWGFVNIPYFILGQSLEAPVLVIPCRVQYSRFLRQQKCVEKVKVRACLYMSTVVQAKQV